jgi:hypothetical protein
MSMMNQSIDLKKPLRIQSSFEHLDNFFKEVVIYINCESRK